MATQVGRLVSREYSDQIFSVHPLAEKAYLHEKQLNRQYNLDLLTVEAVQKIQATHPHLAIKPPKADGQKDTDQILFYANWVWLDLIKHHKITNVYVLEIEEFDIEDISILAWSYVASEELLAINRSQNFRELGKLMQRIIDESGSSPIRDGSQKITVSAMEKLSGESRGVIRGQQPKNVIETSGLEAFISQDKRQD